jgi:hypothetical protein
MRRISSRASRLVAWIFSYDTYAGQVRVLVMTIFVAAQAPELVSRDLRSRVLPLYSARPMRRGDYPLAKLTALIAACLAMIEIPLLLLYLGTAASLTIVVAAVPGLIAGLIATGGATRLAVGLFAGAVAGSVIYSAIFVALSAATARALPAGLFYVLLWEGVLANLVGGARMLSGGHYGLALANSVAHDAALAPGLSLATAIVLGTPATVGALDAAVRKLSLFSLRGDAA